MIEPQHDPFEDDALERAHAALISYPQFKSLHRDIKQCQQLSKIAGEPQCMSLEGVPGAGKSTLAKVYARAFPRVDTVDRTLVPVFYVQTPSPVTIKGMAVRMLEKLGDPGFKRVSSRADVLDTRLVNLIIASKVELVILDDFHHLIDKKTHRVLEAVSDWLKVLIKEAEVPFLVVGIEGQVKEILKANAQLSRLFAIRETLRPFQWDTQKPNTIKDFAQFIALAETTVQMPLTTEIRRTQLLFRIYYSTRGVVGNIMNLMRTAQFHAINRKSPSIELCDFSQAFQQHLAEHLGIETNPFEVKEDELTLPPQEPEINQTKGASDGGGEKKRRGRKKKSQEEPENRGQASEENQ